MLPGKAYKPEDVLQILQRRIWILLVPFAVVSAAVATWVHLLPDQYRSETVVLVVPAACSGSLRATDGHHPHRGSPAVAHHSRS